VIIVLRIVFPAVDQRRLVPLVLPEMEFAVDLISVLITVEQSFCLGFLAGLHPLWHDVGESSLADHLQNVLTIKLPVHQHVIDVDEPFSYIQQILNDFLS